MRAVAIAVLLLAVGAAAQTPSSLVALLNNDAFKPFITKAMSIPVCMSDPDNLAKFDMTKCQGLSSLMTDVFNNVSDPAVSCEMSCLDQFDLLPKKCVEKLRESFEKDGSMSNISQLATEWFMACDQLLVAPAPAPAMADVAVVEEAPAEMEAAPEPVPTPVATTSGAAVRKAAASVLCIAAAAWLLLA